MPQFVIEREIPGAGALSEKQIQEVSLRSLQVLKEMGPQIQWLHSYVTEDKLYCVYLAPDEETVREHARRTGIPANRVAAVRRFRGSRDRPCSYTSSSLSGHANEKRQRAEVFLDGCGREIATLLTGGVL